MGALGSQNSLGGVLRRWRESRGVTMSRLAETAGVSRMTLHRWEAGSVQPRLPELEAVLQSLGIPLEERRSTIALINAPRAVAQVRAALAFPADEEGDAAGQPLWAAGGDLLRALRRRRGLTQRQVATRMKVTQSAVACWERSKSQPPEGRLAELLEFLGALPEESHALTGGRLLAAPALGVTQESAEAELSALKQSMNQGETRLMDLRFLTLEARLQSCLAGDAGARFLLADAYRTHGRWLWWRGRLQEAQRCAVNALELLPFTAKGDVALSLLFDAIHIAGGAIAARNTPAASRTAIRYIHYWLPLAERPEDAALLYRDFADYLIRDGRRESAIEYASRSREAAERTQQPEQIALSQYNAACTLMQVGRGGEALNLLRTEELEVPIQNLNEAMMWCETLISVKEFAEATRWLERAYRLIVRHDLTHLKSRADAAAKRL